MTMKVAFLLSRQARTLTPETWWVRATREVSKWAVSQGWTLICGRGFPPHDLATCAYQIVGGNVETVDLPKPGRSRKSRLDALRRRDAQVIQTADVIVAVAVRTGGIMESEGLAALQCGKHLFAVKPNFRSIAVRGNWNLIDAGAHELSLAGVSSDADADVSGDRHPPDKKIPELAYFRLDLRGRHSLSPVRKISESGILWHFARAMPGPWPGQIPHEYFADLVRRRPGAAHSGLDTLARILVEKKIRASSKIIRGGFPVVCLTEAAPATILSSRQFRSTLVRWDFEPFGIGIDIDSARHMGARAISYLPSDRYAELPEADRPFFQKSEPGAKDFRHEREWRIAGDVDLAALRPAQVFVVIPADDEKELRPALSALRRLTDSNPPM